MLKDLKEKMNIMRIKDIKIIQMEFLRIKKYKGRD